MNVQGSDEQPLGESLEAHHPPAQPQAAAQPTPGPQDTPLINRPTINEIIQPVPQTLEQSPVAQKKIEEVKEEKEKEPVAPFFGITSIQVLFPTLHSRFFGSYMEYKINFVKNGEHLSVVRRFNDMDYLRKGLRVLLPGILIFPMHPKKTFVS